MHLSKLRLVGFKSFVEATEFIIQPGLTGVIGPNGCGKSNLVEALRWVMGENSYKSMRASGMDDVIFSGGGDRPARNMAEVGLVLDNARRTAPAQFNTSDVIEVTRRIERGEGSTYRINGRECRARDVQILFADASTGARSPALVRQGQISEIIAAKPQARRRILEEAAGVAGLHTRRHEAELRLKGAEDNLARIEDVLTQIDAQGEALRRQARQAQRYRDLQAEIRRVQALAILIDYEAAAREAAEAHAGHEAEAARAIEATRRQGEAARHQAVAAYALPALRDGETAAAAALQRVVVARETLDGEERRAKGRLVEIERRLAELTADLARDRAALEDATGVLQRLDAEDAALASEEAASEAELDLRETLAEAELMRAEAEAGLVEAQTRRAEMEARRTSLAERLREEANRRERHEREQASAADARESLLAALEAADGLDASAEALEIAAEALAIAEDEAQAAEAAQAATREAELAARRPAAEAERVAQQLATELRTLTKLLDAGSASAWPAVADAITVAKGYEAALGAALGDDLDASLDAEAPAHWVELAAAADAPLPQAAEALAARVEAPPALRHRLAQVGVVARSEGATLRGALRPGQRLVSREGDIWRWDGFTQTAEAPTPAARRLAERNRLADLRLDAAAAQEKADLLVQTAEAAQMTLRDAAAREQSARGALQSKRRALEAARAEHAAATRRRGEHNARLLSLDAAMTAAARTHAETMAKLGELQAASAELAPASILAEALEAAGQRAARVRAQEAEARSALQAWGRERDTRDKRHGAIAAERRSWQNRLDQADDRRDDMEARIAAALAERDELAEAPDRFVLARRTILSDIAAAETTLRAAVDARQAGETALAEADREARAALAEMSAAREEKARGETRVEVARVRLDAVTKLAATELECEPSALFGLAGVKPDEERQAAGTVAARLDALRGDRERLGAVNLRADEELAAVEEQRGALGREREDLSEAIRRLRQAIASLNKEGRERLLGAFDAVNLHFKDLFTTLFGGGTAELQLVESDDPLEAGLEILARPPGKKPQVMTLLSGGEQALTAMSLIFAVFLTNPSPICVLDEVDAPLDDANVERFCDLVDEMRTKTDTRFVTITHNPITMARMDRLFGVTMAERGVSQLVSVDLTEAEQMLEAV